MSWLQNIAVLETEELEDDRRFDSRKKVLKRIRLRHMDGLRDDEVGTVIDLSRDGLYFTTSSHEHRLGMELLLMFPEAGSECICEVVRTETLPNGLLGVGARILGWQRFEFSGGIRSAVRPLTRLSDAPRRVH